MLNRIAGENSKEKEIYDFIKNNFSVWLARMCEQFWFWSEESLCSDFQRFQSRETLKNLTEVFLLIFHLAEHLRISHGTHLYHETPVGNQTRIGKSDKCSKLFF